MTTLQGHIAKLSELEPHVGIVRGDQPVKLWTRTPSGIETTRVFPTLDACLDAVTSGYAGNPCSCMYDEETDVDATPLEEGRVCTFARAVEDFAAWSLSDEDGA